MNRRLIDTSQLPDDLRSMTSAELRQVANELRDELISTVSQSGGHFASSLGANELTVALHACFNTPHDRLIWDVGHQAYIHKMLTGRRALMGSIRQQGGISGFLRRDESQFDAFGAGHAGTSISAGVGMKMALNHKDSDQYVVPIIGDGSLTSGMAFEALNHAGALRLDNFVVVLNDNEMSISENVGALSWLFSRTLTGETSSKARGAVKKLRNRGYIPDILYKAVDRAEELTQSFFSTPAMLFEAFGFRYIGPVDGHDISALTTALQNAKRQDGPVLVHCYTTKGKGYQPAEADPIKWHGVTPFDPSKAEFRKAKQRATSAPSYTGVFASSLTDIAQEDPSIIAITAAMPGGTGLDKMATVLPKQVNDVGICEQHAVTYAAGLACEGYKPVVAIYSTFLQRAYDQIVHDVCIQELPVVFAIDRAGVVGNDGETHQGVFDISYLRSIPNMVLMSPKDEAELRNMVYSALSYKQPVALRYPRGNGLGVPCDSAFSVIEQGKAEVLRSGADALLIGFGPVVHNALSAAEQLHKQGIECTVVNARFAKPLDTTLLAKLLPDFSIVCTIEDHSTAGGFGSAVSEFVHSEGIPMKASIKLFGVGDSFVPHGSQAEQQKLHGYDAATIAAYVESKSMQRSKVA